MDDARAQLQPSAGRRARRGLAGLRASNVVALGSRARWLSRPWFFGAVAVLAVNDHVLKETWPGQVSGKVSDIAGLVVVATMAAVIAGRTWGLAAAGVAFSALKAVPGVAEAAAPALGGGVTLRDETDLVALASLPVLWFALGRGRDVHQLRRDRRRHVVGVLLAVVATTATTPPADSELSEIGYLDGDLYAGVYLEGGTSVWLRSADRGRTWGRTGDPGEMSDAAYLQLGSATPGGRGEGALQQCAADGVCWRARSHLMESGARWEHLVERRDPGGDWVVDLDAPWPLTDLAVDVDDSTDVAVTDGTSVFVRGTKGRWSEFSLIPLAEGAD